MKAFKVLSTMQWHILRRLRRAGLGWRTIADRYNRLTGEYLSHMTLRRRYSETELTIDVQEEPRDNNH